MKKVLLTVILLILISVKSFGQCAGTETSTVSPLPTNGTYAPSTTVTFCYNMDGFNQVSSNWIEGFDLTFGPGWDLSTLTPILLPNSCSSFGQWGFYNSVTSTNSGLTFGPGFFYDTYNFNNLLDGNPGNDWGDYTQTGTCQWGFCFVITTLSACNALDLSVLVTALGDGTAGSWVNQSCPLIPYQLVAATCAYACNLDVTTNFTNPKCYNICDGTISTVIDSGLAPIQYIWNTTDTIPNLANLCDGAYSVTITDANGCSVINTFNLVEPNQFTLDSNIQNVICNGDSNGQINLFNQLGGTLPYSYLWNTGGINDTLSNLSGGTYTVIVTDANSCNYTFNYTVIEPTQLLGQTVMMNANCISANNGQILASATGGTGVYNFDWGIDTSALLQNLVPGIYQVLITDSNNCSVIIADTVGYNNLFTLYLGADVTIDNNSTYTLNANIAPYNNSYNYNWNPGGVTTSFLYVQPDTTTTYIVIVNDGYGCWNTDTIVVYVLPTSYFYVPNAFSPNDDGTNDFFEALTGEIIQIKSFRIYSRWGEMVYSGDNGNKWDGAYRNQKCNMGVYVYCIEYTMDSDKLYMSKGDITLLR